MAVVEAEKAKLEEKLEVAQERVETAEASSRLHEMSFRAHGVSFLHIQAKVTQHQAAMIAEEEERARILAEIEEFNQSIAELDRTFKEGAKKIRETEVDTIITPCDKMTPLTPFSHI